MSDLMQKDLQNVERHISVLNRDLKKVAKLEDKLSIKKKILLKQTQLQTMRLHRFLVEDYIVNVNTLYPTNIIEIFQLYKLTYKQYILSK